MSMGNYDIRPEIQIKGRCRTWEGYADIAQAIREKLDQRAQTATAQRGKTTGTLQKERRRRVVAVECYPGTDLEELNRELFPLLAPTKVLQVDDYADSAEQVQARIRDVITQDRVFGVMSHYVIGDFFTEEGIAAGKKKLEQAEGLIIVYGFGTDLIVQPDVLVYADLTRWEIQLRYRRGMCNWKTDNAEEDPLRKNKRGYFFEWRMADRQKTSLYDRMDFIMETVVPGKPVMAEGEGYRAAVQEAAGRPFRLVPYFDPSVWGGHWMQERFHLDPDRQNFGWAFDGVPEENSVIFNLGGIRMETPALNIVLQAPDALLGPKVHARFGREFPIRFDYLDTMGGGNLSLQVHPLVEYAQDKFGIHYTQDESYYILDASEHSCVYLGVKENVDKDELVAELEKAQEGKEPFPAERFVNCFPVKKHDHVAIPAGTIHCSGSDTVVLEISATPYIFTFKLWDWDRVGLDGKPRPVHIGHGKHNIRMNRSTEFCEKYLINRADAPHENLAGQEGVRAERTGLHELEFLETRRYWFCGEALLETHESVNMLNLVEGTEADIISVDGSFEPFRVHYGETFIVPESVKKYIVRNAGNQKREIGLIQAFVRNL